MQDLVVIGGGVCGTSAALTAARAGFGQIMLLEKNAYVGGESSGKSGGIISQLIAHPDDQRLVARSREWLFEAEAESGDHSMIQRWGGLVLCSEAESRKLMEVAETLRARDIPFALWDRAAIAEHYPLIDGAEPGTFGIFSPTDLHVNPTAYCQSVFSAARAAGVDARVGVAVTDLHLEADRVVLETSAGRIEAARVLIAAGTWTRKLTKMAGIDIPYRPYRVQIASIAFAESGRLPILSETSTDMYITPDGPTNLLAGDGTQLWEHDPDDYNQQGDAAFEEDIAAGLMRLISAARHAELRRSWAGLCGGTPDRRPLVGAVSERLFIACGDNGFGVVLGPALGELACRIAMGEETAPGLDPFRFPPGDFVLRPGSGGMFPE